LQRVIGQVTGQHMEAHAGSPQVAPCSGHEGLAVTKVHSKCTVVTLDRQKALNALNLTMVQGLLETVEEAADAYNGVLLFEGAGARAFCAGGDIRALAESAVSGKLSYCAEFFSTEYRMNAKIAELQEESMSIESMLSPTTCVALVHGVCMGGGVGVSVHAPYRVVSETLKFAMPETGIGFFCDVGGSFFLPRMPGAVGMYVGLTGARLDYNDALYAGFATHFCPTARMGELKAMLVQLSKNGTNSSKVANALDDHLRQYASEAKPEESTLARHRKDVDACFGADSVQEIFARLETYEADPQWAAKTLQTLKKKSPTSVRVVFELLRTSGSLSIDQALEREFNVAMRFMRHPDFYEGVRAVIIDKTNSPNWSPMVDDAGVQEFFQPDKDGFVLSL